MFFLFGNILSVSAQTIEEKINITYDSFNAHDFNGATIFLNEIEFYLVSGSFNQTILIDFYDIAVYSLVQSEKFESATIFAQKKRDFIISKIATHEADSMIVATDISLHYCNLMTQNTAAADSAIERILESTKNRGGYYFEIYFFYSLKRAEGFSAEEDFNTAKEILESLEKYCNGRRETDSIDLMELYVDLGTYYMETSCFEQSQEYLQKAVLKSEFSKDTKSSEYIRALVCLGVLSNRNRRLFRDRITLYKKLRNKKTNSWRFSFGEFESINESWHVLF